MKAILVGVAAVPVLALFLGVGVLAMQVGDTWDQRNTDALVTGLVSVCAGGALMVAIMLGLIVGVPLALRAYERGGEARHAQPPVYVLPPASSRPPAWAEQPPMLTDNRQQGSWQSAGREYDLWEQPQEQQRWGQG